MPGNENCRSNAKDKNQGRQTGPSETKCGDDCLQVAKIGVKVIMETVSACIGW